MYFGEFRLNWQPLLSASIGIALGSDLSHYTMSLFGPPLIAEFGWSNARRRHYQGQGDRTGDGG